MTRELWKLTPEQHRDIVDELARLPLSELRKRQDLVVQQQRMIPIIPKDQKARAERAARNLQIMADHLMYAVMLKTDKSRKARRSGAPRGTVRGR